MNQQIVIQQLADVIYNYRGNYEVTLTQDNFREVIKSKYIDLFP